MPALICQEAKLLIDNAAEALRRLCELPADPTDNALQMDVSEAIHDANKHMADHMMRCPICRTD
jgi:hypothetical protein